MFKYLLYYNENMPKKQKILLTTALPYANGPIHIGHLVEYIEADIYVRFMKLTGEDIIYCCADDTHGAPIEIKAKELGIKPEELIKKFFKEHTRDFKAFKVEFDSYYTTNSKENKHYSDYIFNKAKEKGYIYKKEIEITYCNKCKRTLPDRYVKGRCPKCKAEDQYGDVCEKCNATYKTTDLIEPYCTICKSKPIRKNAEHYFFRLSAFSFKLKKWLDKNKELQPAIKHYVYDWIKKGLEDWCISRDAPYFGFKIPGEKDKYYYVWLDAPIGYIASTANYCKKHNRSVKDYWGNKENRIMHFIGKDIIYFHFLFWPAMLMAADFSLPSSIIVHGFLTVNKEKMSKSRGTFYTAEEFAKLYNPELLRFYFARNLSRDVNDIDLSFDDFRSVANNELVANIGNFCYRVLSFLDKNFKGKVKGIDKNSKLTEQVNKRIETVKEGYSSLNIKDAVKGILEISAIGNKYFQEKEPWKLIKTDKEKAHDVLGLSVNIVKILAVLVAPITPEFSSELKEQLNLKKAGVKELNFKLKNHKAGKPKIVISKIEVSKMNEFPLNLKVGKIINVKEHPNADKLVVVDVDLGAEERTLVAGLKEYYSGDELTGKLIVVVTNLKPANLRGVVSNGMLLAGDDGKDVGLLTVAKSKPGDKVYFDNYENSGKEISFEEFLKIEMKVKAGKVMYEGKALKTDKEEVGVEKVKDGAKVR
ncbi:methionine--tRNA ligase [Candidatus Woesearchaeota archaeon]|nr:methionine--tRNA ligase [Candidatus Woesearchaeota archaeon]|tara:strand:- start:9856 stop:11961 length:2106 start_codon:yes stop_codon:yes gene_type:complete